MLARLTKVRDEHEEGFTLIELLVVIIIIGILAAIAIPVFLSQRSKGYDSAAKSDLRNFATAEESYLTDFDTYNAAYDTINTAETVKRSGNVGKIGIKLDTTNASNGYCLGIMSRSGKVFYYDSETGGLKKAFDTDSTPSTAYTATTPATGACNAQTMTVPAYDGT